MTKRETPKQIHLSRTTASTSIAKRTAFSCIQADLYTEHDYLGHTRANKTRHSLFISVTEHRIHWRFMMDFRALCYFARQIPMHFRDAGKITIRSQSECSASTENEWGAKQCTEIRRRDLLSVCVCVFVYSEDWDFASSECSLFIYEILWLLSLLQDTKTTAPIFHTVHTYMQAYALTNLIRMRTNGGKNRPMRMEMNETKANELNRDTITINIGFWIFGNKRKCLHTHTHMYVWFMLGSYTHMEL